MVTFLILLAILVCGYFVYGLVVEKILHIDPNHLMPAYTKRDNADYMPLPTWKVFLIQFLNIAGLGPIFGAIMGVMFGPAAFLWIVLGTIFAGAVHDFISGVMSIRSGGLSLPELVGTELGVGLKQVMRVFSVLLLVMVVAVFVANPAGLIANMTHFSIKLISWEINMSNPIFWVCLIFIYYVLATILPIDKLIGNLYPIFGIALLFMAISIMCVFFVGDVHVPEAFADGLKNYHPEGQPVFPMMFVTIACGAISGFHATQSPMMARCLKNEKLARPIFYGAMVSEGIVALIWATAAVTFTDGYEQVGDYLSSHGYNAGELVSDISFSWLGTVGGVIALIGVIAAPISTGDTALRSARLVVADMLHLDQSKPLRRAMITIPLFLIAFFMVSANLAVLWQYFAWCNQTLAVFTLWAITVYLARHKSFYFITLIPAMFMTVVSVSYILHAPEGFGIDATISTSIGCVVAVVLYVLYMIYMNRLSTGKIKKDFAY